MFANMKINVRDFEKKGCFHELVLEIEKKGVFELVLEIEKSVFFFFWS